MLGDIGTVYVVEGAVLADENNDVFDRTLGVKIPILFELQVVLALLVILGPVRKRSPIRPVSIAARAITATHLCVICSYAYLLEIDLLSIATLPASGCARVARKLKLSKIFEYSCARIQSRLLVERCRKTLGRSCGRNRNY
jgi:hypothetical protein